MGEHQVRAFPCQAIQPFKLSTKGALEAHRSQTQAPLSVDFVLAAGATDKFEIASLASDGALGWCVTHPAGDATFLLDKTYILTVEVTGGHRRSEEHTSELQSLMRISYAVYCLKKNTK